jgi:hypothetical protein
VYWQAGQWDSDPTHVYVANIGDDTAYQVSVTACDEVVERTRSVPPYRIDRWAHGRRFRATSFSALINGLYGSSESAGARQVTSGLAKPIAPSEQS